MHFSFVIRQIGALLCAGTLAFEYCRDPNVTVENFSNWALLVHFIYFQLPLRSKAVAFAHPTSFIGANMIPVMYLFLLFWKPSLEVNHMDQWDMPWFTIVTRSFLVHFAPLLFHALDITSNQAHLIHSYKTKPKRVIYPWSLLSFLAVGLVFEFLCPDSDSGDMENLQGIEASEFLTRNKIVALLSLLFSFSILYFLVLRRAHHSYNNGHNNSNNSSSSSTTVHINKQ